MGIHQKNGFHKVTPVPPPQLFYMAYIKTETGLRYLSMVQAVGLKQARQRLLADWKGVAPQMVQEILDGKTILIMRRSGIKKALKETTEEPKKKGFFDVFGEATKTRMEIGFHARGMRR